MAQDSERDDGHGPTVKEVVGGVREAVGWATGDRRVQAEGEVELEQAAAEQGEVEPGSVESVEEAEERVRSDHGDLGT